MISSITSCKYCAVSFFVREKEFRNINVFVLHSIHLPLKKVFGKTVYWTKNTKFCMHDKHTESTVC